MAVWNLWILCGVTLLAVQVDSAMYIRDCSDDKITAIEDTNVTLICGQYQNEVRWYWSEVRKWLGSLFGSCNRTECNRFALPVNLSALTTSVSGSYQSQLDIRVVTRYQLFVYHCRNTDTGETATCGLRVTAPAIISGDNCSVWVSDWQIYGTCAVERMYASDNVYNCIWRKNNNQIQEGFQEPITYYNLNPRIYGRGVCSFSQNMPVDQGNYTYSVDIDPGNQNFFYKTINIVPPGEPNHDCPETVFVGSNVSCKCTSSNPGTPPAEFVWDGSGTDTLFLQDMLPQNNTINYSCRLIWGPNGYINNTIFYTLRIAENKKEKNTEISGNDKGGIIGGCVAAVFILAIIGIVIAVYIVKWRKGMFGRGNINLRFWQCLCKFFHRKIPPTTPYAVVNKPKPQFPIRRPAASSGDLYTVAMTTTSSDLNGEYVTICGANEDTVFTMIREGNKLARQETSESRTAFEPAMKSKPITPGTRNVSEIPDYMNVTEVPTDSGLGVYEVVPCAVTPTGTKADILDNYEEGISEEEYNALQFKEDRTAQEDHASTYHHLQHE